jgi:hypothetical protein
VDHNGVSAALHACAPNNGTPAFWASYGEAIRDRRIPEPGRFGSLVTLYRASPDYQKLADSTKRNWARWLDEIADYFGPLSIAQFDRPEKIRAVIRQWRNRWADKPRTADFALQVLSRVLSHVNVRPGQAPRRKPLAAETVAVRIFDLAARGERNVESPLPSGTSFARQHIVGRLSWRPHLYQ